MAAAAGLAEAWDDSDSYYFRILARVQKLRGATKDPNRVFTGPHPPFFNNSLFPAAGEARRSFSKELSLAEAVGGEVLKIAFSPVFWPFSSTNCAFAPQDKDLNPKP